MRERSYVAAGDSEHGVIQTRKVDALSLSGQTELSAISVERSTGLRDRRKVILIGAIKDLIGHLATDSSEGERQRIVAMPSDSDNCDGLIGQNPANSSIG